jgi:hypothetical protein
MNRNQLELFQLIDHIILEGEFKMNPLKDLTVDKLN